MRENRMVSGRAIAKKRGSTCQVNHEHLEANGCMIARINKKLKGPELVRPLKSPGASEGHDASNVASAYSSVKVGCVVRGGHSPRVMISITMKDGWSLNEGRGGRR